MYTEWNRIFNLLKPETQIRLFAHCCVNIPKALSLKTLDSLGISLLRHQSKRTGSGWSLCTGCSFKVIWKNEQSLGYRVHQPTWCPQYQLINTYVFKLQTMSFRKTRGTFFQATFRKAILQVSLNVGKSYLLPWPPPSHCMKAITFLHQQYSKDKNLRIKKISPQLNKFSFKKAYYTMNFYLGTTYLHGLIAGALQT